MAYTVYTYIFFFSYSQELLTYSLGDEVPPKEDSKDDPLLVQCPVECSLTLPRYRISESPFCIINSDMDSF